MVDRLIVLGLLVGAYLLVSWRAEKADAADAADAPSHQPPPTSPQKDFGRLFGLFGSSAFAGKYREN
jgi:hypothetical protein